MLVSEGDMEKWKKGEMELANRNRPRSECLEYCMKVMNIISREYCKYVIFAFPCTVMKYNPVSYVKKFHFIRAVVMS